MYLDGGGTSHDEATSRIIGNTVQKDLLNTGFVVNKKKNLGTNRLTGVVGFYMAFDQR